MHRNSISRQKIMISIIYVNTRVRKVSYFGFLMYLYPSQPPLRFTRCQFNYLVINMIWSVQSTYLVTDSLTMDSLTGDDIFLALTHHISPTYNFPWGQKFADDITSVCHRCVGVYIERSLDVHRNTKNQHCMVIDMCNNPSGKNAKFRETCIYIAFLAHVFLILIRLSFLFIF